LGVGGRERGVGGGGDWGVDVGGKDGWVLEEKIDGVEEGVKMVEKGEWRAKRVGKAEKVGWQALGVLP